MPTNENHPPDAPSDAGNTEHLEPKLPLNLLGEFDPAIRRIYGLFGADTVLVPVAKDKLNLAHWHCESASLETSRTSAWQSQLIDSSVGVICGQQSGGLCAILITDGAAIKNLFDENPRLHQTLVLRRRDYLIIFIRVVGEHPQSRKFNSLTWLTDGYAVGIHVRPGDDGVPAEILRNHAPIEIEFTSIRWPADVVSGLQLDRIKERYGLPTVDHKGKSVPNSDYWVATFCELSNIRFHSGTRGFYQKGATGNCWEERSCEKVLSMLIEFLQRMSRTPDCAYVSDLFRPEKRYLLVENLKVVAVGDFPHPAEVLRRFINDNVESSDGANVTSDELCRAYRRLARLHHWPLIPDRKLHRELKRLMEEEFETGIGHSIIRDGTSRRGYRNVHLKLEAA